MTTLTRLARANPVPHDAVPGLQGRLPDLRLEGPPGHRATRSRRRFVVVGVAIAAVAVAAPAMALGTAIPQTISGFFASDAPPQAKSTLAPLIASTLPPSIGHPDSIQLALRARGPDGEIDLYAVHLDNGDVATSIVDVSNDPPHVAGTSGGPPVGLADGQVFDVRGAAGSYPGERPIYFSGIVAPQVARIDLVYQDGSSESVATGGGYMLGWISPTSDRTYGDSQLLAFDRSGNQIGRIDVCDIGPTHDVQFHPHTAAMPDDTSAACAISPPQDHG